jgi:ABC-2 type transport system permease protein
VNAGSGTTAVAAPPRPFYWSLRRELWENRSIYFGPAIVAGLVLLGFVFSLRNLPERRRAVLLLDPAKQQHAIQMPYDAATGMLLVAAFVIGAFYCLDALFGERRERSILFWKSLPVSDRTTVLAKITIPLLILPLICVALTFVAHLLMFGLSSAVLLAAGISPATTLANVPLLQLWVAMLCGWIAAVLWHAPIYAWLLLVSGWARRATFLWAVLPLVAVGVFERVAFNTNYVAMFVKYRLIGWFFHAFALPPKDTVVEPLAQITLGRYFSTPGVWLGLIFAGAFLFAAVRLRRYRGPV